MILGMLKGIVGAVVIFDHGRKFGIFSIASDHPAPRKSFAIKKNTFRLLNPCEHRATIVALAYLKSFKNGKKQDRRIFSFKHIIKHFDSVPK